jgi:hypothetical protein
MPAGQFSFDMTKEPIPVMLTPVAGKQVRTLKFDVGYKTSQLTRPVKDGSGQESTVSETQLVNTPLSDQITRKLDPLAPWARVKDMAFHASDWVWGILVVSDDASYGLNLTIDVPNEGAKK